MVQLKVELATLPAMRVASALGFGAEPEGIAWDMIASFAQEAGIDLVDKDNVTFGFNNPDPSPGSENYGYEIWLPVAASVVGVDPVQIKDFAGGTYATTRFTGLSNIGRVWKELVAWVEDSPHSFGPDFCHCLEKLHNPLETDPEKYVFDLYLSVRTS
ncbi:MAG: AraC family transcriptional regulator [Candidatus Atribacteria bacterium]|nr:MAG: AraC family transcriptional regulator [Candidatus Atribacteria bacterium]